MTDIDWSKAPEGATHYMPETESSHAVWVMVSGNTRLAWLASGDSSWEIDRSLEEDREYLIPRPAPQWNGEGLPPVDTSVLLDDARFPVFDDYQEMIGVPVVVTAVFKSPTGVDMIACALPGGLCGCFRAVMAHPIKTPAQIAAEERDAAIGRMRECFDSVSDDLCPTSNQYLETLFGALHDAGYRLTAGDDK